MQIAVITQTSSTDHVDVVAVVSAEGASERSRLLAAAWAEKIGGSVYRPQDLDPENKYLENVWGVKDENEDTDAWFKFTLLDFEPVRGESVILDMEDNEGTMSRWGVPAGILDLLVKKHDPKTITGVEFGVVVDEILAVSSDLSFGQKRYYLCNDSDIAQEAWGSFCKEWLAGRE